MWALVRHPRRARGDVALLFGVTGLAVALQEFPRLTGRDLSAATGLIVVLMMAMPVLLLRLVDNFHDVPQWVQWGGLGGWLLFSVLLALLPPPLPAALSLSAVAYLVLVELYAAWAFVARARRTAGITSRRMWAAASACVLLAAVFPIVLLGAAVSALEPVGALLGQVATLFSGIGFYAAFFPPPALRQAWKLPELFQYLGTTRWNPALEADDPGRADQAATEEADAIDRLLVAVTRATGGRRAVLALRDAEAGEFCLWGTASSRVTAEEGLIGAIASRRTPHLIDPLRPDDVPPAVRALFGGEAFPRSALVAPVLVGARVAGALAVYADKGPIFVQDDLDVVQFFASEAAAILRGRSSRHAANELAALREADRLKDEFMAVVSHELRTPLTAISGYADLLMRTAADDLTSRQERHVLGIREAARRLLMLVNDLLDVSKLEAGTVEIHLGPIDPAAAVERAVAGTRVIAAKKGVALEIVHAPGADASLRVLADEDRLQQVLTNLLVNSIKFTPDAGSVTVSWRPEFTDHHAWVVFQVTDTGIGMAPAQVERVFERFYQAEPSSTRQFGGAGLGLSIVAKLVELQDGAVEAASQGVGRGSSFTVRLPLFPHAVPAIDAPSRLNAAVRAPVPSAAALASGAHGTSAVAPGTTVLVVEDDPDISTVLTTYLEEDGYAVAHATDGLQAIQMAKSLHPFAITLDVMLPKLDGWSVLNILKRDPATEDIPVVMLSMVDNRDFGLALGASEYLLKPIQYERLHAVLNQLAGCSRPET